MTNAIDASIESEEETQKGKYLTFSLGKEVFGIEIRFVTEIIGLQSITEVPELPDYVKGIINLRGKIIPVVDVRLRFKKKSNEYNDRTCIIVIDVNNLSVGLIVDTVAEVISISENNLVPPPQSNNFHNKYIKCIGKVGSNVNLLLDCEKLLSDDEIESLVNL